MLLMIGTLSLCRTKVCLWTGTRVYIYVCVWVSLRGREDNYQEKTEVQPDGQIKGTSLKLSAGQCFVPCFVPNCLLFFCFMTTLPWRCQLQSAVSMMTHTLLVQNKISSFYLNAEARMWGNARPASTSTALESEDGWAFLTRSHLDWFHFFFFFPQ